MGPVVSVVERHIGGGVEERVGTGIGSTWDVSFGAVPAWLPHVGHNDIAGNPGVTAATGATRGFGAHILGVAHEARQAVAHVGAGFAFAADLGARDAGGQKEQSRDDGHGACRSEDIF
jgi:hypothetical protein